MPQQIALAASAAGAGASPPPFDNSGRNKSASAAEEPELTIPGGFKKQQPCFLTVSLTSPGTVEIIPSGSRGMVSGADPNDSERILVTFTAPGGKIFQFRLLLCHIQAVEPVIPGGYRVNEVCFLISDEGAERLEALETLLAPLMLLSALLRDASTSLRCFAYDFYLGTC
jgi:hypothetical protein